MLKTNLFNIDISISAVTDIDIDSWKKFSLVVKKTFNESDAIVVIIWLLLLCRRLLLLFLCVAEEIDNLHWLVTPLVKNTLQCKCFKV